MADSDIEWTDKTWEKWCARCQQSHPRTAFGKDATRADGLAFVCLASRRTPAPKKRGFKKGAYRHGWLTSARDGDRRQARRRVNYLVEQGRLLRPNDVPCIDCGHVTGDGRRHEYDHYRGYAAVHHFDVQVVCSKCHHARERQRVA